MHASWKLFLQSCLIVACAWNVPTAAMAEPPCVVKAKNVVGPDETDGCAKAMNMESARGVSMGTGARATSMSTSALMYNPAALSLGRLYHVEGNIDYIHGDTTALGATVVDSSTSSVGAGIGARGFLSGKDGLKGWDGKLGLGFGFNQQISLGISGRYIDLYTERDEIDPDMPNDPGTIKHELAKGFTMDASFRITPTQGVHLSILTYNFIDLESQYVPVMMGGSIGVELGGGLIVNVDVLSDVSTYEEPQMIAGGGIEMMVSRQVPLRGGYAFDAARELHTGSLGLGYSDRQVGFDFGVAKDFGRSRDLRITVAMRYYVH